MEIREATDSDAAAIRSIAHDSLNSTYTAFLEEETIDGRSTSGTATRSTQSSTTTARSF